MARRFKVRWLSNLIVVISLVFVTIYLVRHHLLVPLRFANFNFLILSFLLLGAGFFLDALIIRLFLLDNDVRLSMGSSVVLSGKFSLAKYIPGKIGVIIGKAAYIFEKSRISNYRAIEMVSVYQILFILSAVILSVMTSASFLRRQSENIVMILILLVLLSILLFLKKTQLLIRGLIKKIFRQELREVYSPRAILIVLIGTTLCWLLWVAGFWLLARSVGMTMSLSAALLFPLATMVGVVAVIAPGGIGVKESVISAGLIFYGFKNADAISLSVYSRLWFLMGEILFFLLAMLISSQCKENKE